MTMLLQLDSISTYYGQIQALRSVSLHVSEGEIVALIGANGAGKSTLLGSISGLIIPRSGQVNFNGQDITQLDAVQIVGLGISHVPEHRQLFDTMTVYENLVLGAYHRHRQTDASSLANDVEEVYALFPRLGERKTQLAGTLSGGEQQMLAIGRGLMAKPKLILLDEPSLGLAPLLARSLFEVITSLRNRGQTVVLVEQNAHAALSLADRAYVMETGRVVLDGPASQLIQDERVQAAYLGRQQSDEK